MSSAQFVRDRFVSGGLNTASPARIVEMAFAHLDRDAAVALEAMAANDIHRAHVALCHAQDLLAELSLMVDADCWEHAGTLVSLYDYIGRLFAHANIKKDRAKVCEARSLLAELGAAFGEAARVSGPSDTAAAGRAAFTTGADAPAGLTVRA